MDADTEQKPVTAREVRALMGWIKPLLILTGFMCILLIGMCFGVIEGASNAAFRLKALRDENASLRSENAKLRNAANEVASASK